VLKIFTGGVEFLSWRLVAILRLLRLVIDLGAHVHDACEPRLGVLVVPRDMKGAKAVLLFIQRHNILVGGLVDTVFPLRESVASHGLILSVENGKASKFDNAVAATVIKDVALVVYRLFRSTLLALSRNKTFGEGASKHTVARLKLLHFIVDLGCNRRRWSKRRDFRLLGLDSWRDNRRLWYVR